LGNNKRAIVDTLSISCQTGHLVLIRQTNDDSVEREHKSGAIQTRFLSGRKWSHTTAAAVAAATAELITSFSIFYYLGRS
jgi:hypothetical protein